MGVSLGLIETMRVDGSHVPLLEAHLRRLRASAAALGLDLPPAEPVAADLVEAARGIAGPAAVRLVLRAGVITLQSRQVPPPVAPWRACLAPGPRGADPLVAHKTTRRDAHEAVAVVARTAGCEEAIWTNAAGHLTEGTISNLFVRRGGRLQTPSLAAGLLPGIARGRLLAAGRLVGLAVVEGDLLPEDLATADEAFVTNAVRGAVPLGAWEGAPLPAGDLWRAANALLWGGG